MLNTLKRLDRSKRDSVLATYLQGLLPNSGTSALKRPYSDDIYQSLQNDIIKALKITPEHFAESKGLVVKYVSDQLRTNVLGSKRINEIRDRIGERGALPLSAYDIRFSSNFTDLCESMGVTRDIVQSAFRSPDDVEHIQFDEMNVGEWLYPTLITKTIRGDDPYVLVVLALRTNAVLRVDAAWMIFHSEVNLDDARTPIQVLAKFVDTYGLHFDLFDGPEEIISTKEHSKLLMGQSRVMRMGSHSLSFRMEEPVEKDIRIRWQISPGRVFVPYAFVIDVIKYKNDMLKHKVNVMRKAAQGERTYSEVLLEMAPENLGQK